MDVLHLTLPDGVHELEVMDARGRVLIARTVQGGSPVDLDVERFMAGTYLLRIWTPGGPQHRVWIKQ